ncbi:hypothetical protein BDV96DRAFT_556736 [Lophiotrema nucula]|uniref:Methyltransferase domain-containing protein n=1 Tax=Lophiotrema nucula TaxID=690887 RepID=A0A6A5YLE9_9PLEO|nr:hypothetical protein BDV96DRAFT_556736 [Lophiotrema nucula]
MNSQKSDVLEETESNKHLPWWLPNIDHRITPDVRHVLETYSKIAPEKVTSLVYAIREQAWALRCWPCTGLGFFLAPMLPHLPNYSSILSTLKAGGTLIDVGCYLGTDLRRLFLDGCPDSNLFGVDIVDHWQLGRDLFRDKEKFHAQFVKADILTLEGEITSLKGKADVVSATHFLHNWNWATQIRACCNLVALTKPQPGSLIVGFQVGTKDPEKAKWEEEVEGKYTLHTPQTFEAMWVEIEKETGTRWKVEAMLREWEEFGQRKEETGWLGEDAAILQFVVTRVA